MVKSPPNCCCPAGMRAWEVQQNCNHAALRSTQTRNPHQSPQAQPWATKWTLLLSSCQPYEKIMHAHFFLWNIISHLQCCRLTIMTRVTFCLLLRQGAFDAVFQKAHRKKKRKSHKWSLFVIDYLTYELFFKGISTSIHEFITYESLTFKKLLKLNFVCIVILGIGKKK